MATHFCPKSHLDKLGKHHDPRAKAVVERMEAVCRAHPAFYLNDERIADMDRYGIDAQLTMIDHQEDPNAFGISGSELLEMCAQVNDECHKFQEGSRGRIFALGTVPLHAGQEDAMREEMRRASEDLGLKGFMVLSNIRGTPIDAFEAFWEEAERLRSVVYIHPDDGRTREARPYEFDYDLQHVFGWPYETTLVLSRLVLGGVMLRHPRLKVVSHHMGGMIPFFAGRIAETYRKNKPTRPESPPLHGKTLEDFGVRASRALETVGLEGPVLDYYKMFYYDTAVGGSAAAIRCGVDALGAERIVFGTDYPWGPEGGRKRLESYPGVLREAVESASDLREMFEGNAKRLLGI